VPSEPADADELAEVVHDGINDYREAQGLEPLDPDDDLSRIAEEHSRRMARGEVPLGHDGFEDRARAIRREVAYRSVAENVGYNRGMADPAADAVARWLHSPQHRENVLGDYEITGVGVAVSSRGDHYFTQIFVAPSD
jgi:uncharacterized protein YkwD